MKNALEQCRNEGETLKAYRNANDVLLKKNEDLEEQCGQMKTEVRFNMAQVFLQNLGAVQYFITENSIYMGRREIIFD